MMTSPITNSMSKVSLPATGMDQGFASALGRVSAVTPQGQIKQAAEQLVATVADFMKPFKLIFLQSSKALYN